MIDWFQLLGSTEAVLVFSLSLSSFIFNHICIIRVVLCCLSVILWACELLIMKRVKYFETTRGSVSRKALITQVRPTMIFKIQCI